MNFYEEDFNPSYFTFCERIILLANIRNKTKPELIDRLDNLLDHTSDPELLGELSSLKEKVIRLSEEQFTLLQGDATSGKVMDPSVYSIHY